MNHLHAAWNETPNGRCGSCGRQFKLVSVLTWEMDDNPVCEVNVRDEVSAHWCPHCQLLTSISVNAPIAPSPTPESGWTLELPTEPGWYWAHRQRDGVHLVAIEVSGGGTTWIRRLDGGGYSTPDLYAGAHWLPIAHPEPPQDNP